MQQLDAETGYREQIEKELASLVTVPAEPRTPNPEPRTNPEPGTPNPEPSARSCPACGTANDADARFCKQCGTSLAVS
jgi:hypothetical protein